MRKQWFFYGIVLAGIIGLASFLEASSYYFRLLAPEVLNSTEAQILVWNARTSDDANTTRIKFINIANTNEENSTSVRIWMVPGNATGNKSVADEYCVLPWTTISENGTIQIDYPNPGLMLTSVNGTLQGQASDGPGNLTITIFGVKE